jgi:DNA recombination protein RmuC
LKELLDNVFWEYQYKMQYKLGDIWIVDAALFVWWKVIPIDSKFPHTNYENLVKADNEADIKIYSQKLKRDIKDKIDETSKYIDTSLNTTDFAFMLIPAEWLYYDIFISKVWNINVKEIIEYGFSKKVIICSPSWFYAYLQTVIQWLRALKVEEETKEIVKKVEKLGRHLNDYEKWFTKLWNSLNLSINHYEDAEKRFWYIEKDVIKIAWESYKQLDKPE